MNKEFDSESLKIAGLTRRDVYKSKEDTS